MHNLELACQTDGELFDTGIRVRGLEVWANPPNRYAHCLTLKLVYPDPIQTKLVQLPPRNYTVHGVITPDLFIWCLCLPHPSGDGYRTLYKVSSEEKVKHLQEKYPVEKLICDFVVNYKSNGQTDGAFTSKEEGIPWGISWGLRREDEWEGFKFQLSREEAAEVLEYTEFVNAEWQRRSQGWIDAESRRTLAIAKAVALDDLHLPVESDLLECLECGAIYTEPGHVEIGGMSCDRCD
jgi:hypothetical protein